jgi:hypothetical protein
MLDDAFKCRIVAVNRRQFLTGLAAATAGGVLFADLLPSSKTFFLPPQSGWAQRSLADLWLDYARQVVSCGVLTRIDLIPGHVHSLIEMTPGTVLLRLATDITADEERGMRDMLSRAPLPTRYPPLMADLVPWQDMHIMGPNGVVIEYIDGSRMTLA